MSVQSTIKELETFLQKGCELAERFGVAPAPKCCCDDPVVHSETVVGGDPPQVQSDVIYEIKSTASGPEKTYYVQEFHTPYSCGNLFTCTCPDFIFRCSAERDFCKHIDRVLYHGSGHPEIKVMVTWLRQGDGTLKRAASIVERPH